MPICPRCSSAKHKKAGFNRKGTQRFQCKACARIYTPKRASKHKEDIKIKAVLLREHYQLTYREIAEILNVNHQSVSNWVDEHDRIPRLHRLKSS
jgi:transposase-like protein